MTKDEIIQKLLPFMGDIETNIFTIKYDHTDPTKNARLVIELKPKE